MLQAMFGFLLLDKFSYVPKEVGENERNMTSFSSAVADLAFDISGLKVIGERLTVGIIHILISKSTM